MQMPALSPASKAVDTDISRDVLIFGNHEVATTGLLNLRSLKFTHTKQRGTFKRILAAFQKLDFGEG